MKLNVFRFRKFDQTLGGGQDKVALIFILNVIEVMSGVEGLMGSRNRRQKHHISQGLSTRVTC